MSGNDKQESTVQNDSRGTDAEISAILATPPDVLDTFDLARFWSRIEVRRSDQCWPWRYGAQSGYGEFRFTNNSREDAHRTAYRVAHGPIAAGVVIRHSCDNGLCCNPAHLIPGTHGDNVKDRVARDRSARGETSGRAKLTEKQVLAMRASPLSDGYWARRHNVDRTTIAAARGGETWTHLPSAESLLKKRSA